MKDAFSKLPLISIVTVVYNGENTIAQCIESIVSQDYPHVEYIVIDGNSKDQTMAIVNRYKHQISHIVSEPDKGIYDAMNKGVRLAKGEIVGILNADDFYPHSKVLQTVANAFMESDIQLFCASVGIFKAENFTRMWRYYDASKFKKWQFILGMQPPHPATFIRKKTYDTLGDYDPDFRISGDFDLLVRMIYVNNLPVLYSKEVLVHMRDGGVSSKDFKSKIKMNSEDLRSLKKYKIKSYILLIWLKYFFKLLQLRS